MQSSFKITHQNYFLLVFLSIIFLLSSCNSWKNNVKTIEVVYQKDKDIKPGSVVEIGIVVTDSSGRIHSTKGLLKGKVKWSAFKLDVNGGSFSDGEVNIANNPYTSTMHRTDVSCVLKSKKNSSGFGSIYLNYKGNTTLSFKGKSAKNEKDRKERIAPFHFMGEGVKKGKPGRDGENGTDGKSIDIYIRRIADSSYTAIMSVPLFEVIIISRIDTTMLYHNFFALDSSKLIVNCDGGNGGDGGDGGPGVNGTAEQDIIGAGVGTDGGDGGNGGRGGRGGNVTLHLKEEDDVFLKQMEISLQAGAGGNPGNGGRGGLGGLRRDGSFAPQGNEGKPGTAGWIIPGETYTQRCGIVDVDYSYFIWPNHIY